MSFTTKLLDFFKLNQIRVPMDTYEISEDFAQKLRASQSQGSVSLGDGRLFTKEKKDALYESVKNYNFVK